MSRYIWAAANQHVEVFWPYIRHPLLSPLSSPLSRLLAFSLSQRLIQYIASSQQCKESLERVPISAMHMICYLQRHRVHAARELLLHIHAGAHFRSGCVLPLVYFTYTYLLSITVTDITACCFTQSQFIIGWATIHLYTFTA